jgi:parvulin-like peptidyl-prolyl isomerase
MSQKKSPKRKLLNGTKKLMRPTKKQNGEHRITIIAKLKKSFNAEDRMEPFENREYADETNRLYDMLMEEYPYDPPDQKDKAVFDIVTDILKECGKEVE